MGQTSTGRRSPALRLAAYIATGILLGRVALPPPELLWTFLAGLAVLLVLSGHRATTPAAVLLFSLLAACICVVIGMTRLSEMSRSSPVPADTLLDGSAVVVGMVGDDPSFSGTRCRFPVLARRLLLGRTVHDLPVRILVTMKWPSQGGDTTRLFYGMQVLLRGKLERPSAERNPGEFDARTYYEANGISLFLRVRSRDSITVLSEGGGSWWMRSFVLPVRRALLRQIDRTVGGDEGEFLKGILIGERSGLSPSLRESFMRSGTAHVLAVSGSNVAVLAGVLFLLLEFLRTGRRWRIALTCACIVFYMMLTGGQPPVVRAGVMAIIVLLAGVVQERPHVLNSLGVAASAILLFDPRQLFDVGFQLSFAAVFSIVLLYPMFTPMIDRLPGRTWIGRTVQAALRLAALSLAATIGTLPLTAICFGRVSSIGLLANIVVVPAVGLSVVLGVASAMVELVSLWMAEAYASINTLVLWLTIRTSVVAGGLSVATIDTPGFRWPEAIAFYAGIMVFLRLRARRGVFPATLLLLASLSASLFIPSPPVFGSARGLLRITFLDVGQGDAAVLELPDGRIVVVDAGGWSPEYDAGERVVVPYLRRRGIRTVDLLVITHTHSDHIGGVPALLRSFPVHRVLDPGQTIPVSLIESAGLRTTGFAGKEVDIGSEARLYVLSPDQALAVPYGAADPDVNNTSVVLKVCYGSMSFLMAGDAGVDAEETMVGSYGDFLRAAVLKVGHHGSAGSSSERFLDAVAPEHAIVSVGRGNVFGHPSQAIIERLAARGIETLRTDEEGAVIFETDGRTLKRLEWR